MKLRIFAISISILSLITLVCWAGISAEKEYELASYATSLEGRNSAQVHNLRLACANLNNITIKPNETFSFNNAIGPWTSDKGYKKAPTSYDGEIIDNWGGGVCQLSSTLYNTALLAGLRIDERNKHQWTSQYAPVGRDAAVAFMGADLIFTNTLPKPITIKTQLTEKSVIVKMYSKYKPNYRIEVETKIIATSQPSEIIQDLTGRSDGRWRLVNKGKPGVETITYRRFITKNKTKTEIISKDQYPPMNKVIRIVER